MSREVQFSFASEAEKEEFVELAKNRGLTLSQLVKWCAFKYRADCVAGAEAMQAYRRRKKQPVTASEADNG